MDSYAEARIVTVREVSSLLQDGPMGGIKFAFYGMVTLDAKNGFKALPLDSIRDSADKLLNFARSNPNVNFRVGRVGCILAEYRTEDIAPMFKNAPANCELHPDWITFNEQVI